MAKTKNRSIPESRSYSRVPFDGDDTRHFLGRNPLWSFKKMDLDHPRWSVSKCEMLYKSIVLKLKDFEGLS